VLESNSRCNTVRGKCNCMCHPQWSRDCVLATGPKVVGSNLAEGDGFLRAIKIQSLSSFR
jgi:hypothetical protein